LYYQSWNNTDDVCEILDFGLAHRFTTDGTNAGTWKGNISLSFTVAGPMGNVGDKYKGKYQATGFEGAAFYGTVTDAAVTWGPFMLIAGSDPMGWGTC